ncbi:hypothetical protein O181_114825 [Austropuccinia psidii MF-1]|uniref:Uncharacterized protein n=1 Tax=Austropuccinia psidii MF-1 TaxID=1389203 RepID=A0A9Q3K968_9BASI|nr:hypothetical protein [Austropuccinia psidii MF-1]
MIIVHKSGNIEKNDYGFSIWALHNTPDNPAYFLANAEPQIPIEGINITDVGTEFFEEVKGSYKQDKNCHILNSLLERYCKDTALASSLHDIWKKSYENGRFDLLDGLIYDRSKHTCVMVLCSRMLINTILIDFPDNIYSVHLS